MAIKPPPPPVKSEPGSFAWMDWYRTLYDFISSAGAIAWNQIDFAGSKLTDITTRLHSNLQSVLGSGQYHISSAEHAKIGNVDLDYGYFLDTTTQTAAAINTAYGVTYNTTIYTKGVTVDTPTSRLKVTKAGLYNFHFSLEAEKTSASAAHIYIWARKNGADIANSATKVTLAGSAADHAPSWNFLVSMSTADYFELMWSTEDTSAKLEYYAASGVVPAIPSVIMSVTQITI